MTTLPLITDLNSSADILRCPCVPFDFENPPVEPMQLALDLIETMYHHNGLGLAANQTGCQLRVFVMRGTMENGDFACFNPRIVHTSEEIVLLEEGCLSFPGVIVKVKRPRHVRMRFQVPSGETITQQFTGMTARVVQHEIDHLNGEIFYLRANKYYRDRAFKNRKKYNVSVVQKDYRPSPFDLEVPQGGDAGL